MILLLLFFEIWLATQTCAAYVLFAANLDDFRNIAKQYIPEHLADQIASLAAKADAQYLQGPKDQDTYDEDREHDLNKYKKRFSVRDTNKKDKYNIDIDEIVKKVKEQLKDDFELREGLQKRDLNEKFTKNKRDKKQKDKYSTKDVMSKEYEDVDDEMTTRSSKFGKFSENDKENRPFEDKHSIYKTVDLMTNDSYEDYETPKKDDVYETEEQTDHRAKNNKNINSKTTKESMVFNADYDLKKSTAKIKSHEDVKGKNERKKEYANLKTTKESTVDDKDIKEVDLEATSESAEWTRNTNKGKKITKRGTVIPKRDFYKMSSPNYYDKVPAIAETYKFDEPIPVKDQEEENLKYYGNPPASINKKVKLIE